jgi:purine-binding chemotaxis protein CheW
MTQMTQASLMQAGTRSDEPDPDENEFLTFTLGAEEYGIDILKVQEIRGYDAITHIANMPAFIKGVVNLRGTIVPIIDLRIKFRLGRVEYNEFTVVIIVNVGGKVMGVVVDSVSDVITLGVDQIKPAPNFSAGTDASYVIGLGTLDDRMLILTDIERLLSDAEMGFPDEPALH